MSRFYDLETELKDENGETTRRALDILVRQDEHHVKGKRLGRHLEHDPLSRGYAIPAHDVVDSELQSVNWHCYAKPFDQGDTGMCTGTAMGALLSTEPFSKGRTLTLEECKRLYSEATHLDRIPGHYPPDDTGSSGLAVAKAAKKENYIAAYRHAFSMRAALKALQNGPVITGFGWYDSFDDPTSTGFVSIQPGAVVRGGHEVMVWGLEIVLAENGEVDESNSFIKLRNSWGEGFAANGDFFMTITTWRHLMKEYGDITVPVPL